MNKFWRAVLINIAVVYLLALLTLSSGDQTGLLILPLLISIFEFFVGLLFLLFTKTKRAGQVMLAASGIIFLVGLGVCTVIPFRIQ